MKKTLSIFVVAMLVLLLSMGGVNAAQDLTVALTSDASVNRVAQGGEVVITLSLNGFKAGETGMNAFGTTLTFDKNIFEAVSASSFQMQNGWTLGAYNAANGELVSTNPEFITANHEVLKLTLKVKANATVGSTTVKFSDTSVAGGPGNSCLPSDKELNLTIISPSNSTHVETNTVKVTTNTTNTTTNKTTNTTTNTTNTTKMPNTGVEDYILPAIAIVAVIGIFAYVRYNRMDK